MKKITNPRQLAVLTLSKLEKTEDFLGEVLDSYLRRSALSDLDQGLYTELVYGTTRMKKNLDYILSLFSTRPLSKIKPQILNNLRVGSYQILYLDKIPPAAAVNESVKLAHLFGHQGVAAFSNAVLRKIVSNKGRLVYPPIETEPFKHLSYKYSFPMWIIQLWSDYLGLDETEQLCRALNRSPEFALRVNTLYADPLSLSSYLQEQGISVLPGRYAKDVLKVDSLRALVGDPAFSKGAYYIQEESSALIAHALKVQPGQLVYDLCSAPGGKTTHLAQLMEDQGRIVAFDSDAKRLKLVEENVQRLGLSIVETQTADATLPLDLPAASRVLVDAPCSGLGTMQQRPDIRWNKKPEEIPKLVTLQKQILNQAANYVQKNGILVYSTCTLTKQENQDVALWFLASQPEFVPERLPDWFPQGKEEWYRTFLPHKHKLSGFFVATFRRV